MKLVVTLSISLFFILNTYSQIDSKHLKVGDKAPKISGIDQFNSVINSSKILKNQKILLVFYRGNWCPYCKKHLASLQDNLEKFQQKGVYVLVVTPEKVEKIKETSKAFKAGFSIIHDSNNVIMDAYKVSFEVNKKNVPNYFEFTLKKIQEYNEIENNVLPVPATYLIEKNHKISYVQYNPDYKKRSNFQEILKGL